MGGPGGRFGRTVDPGGRARHRFLARGDDRRRGGRGRTGMRFGPKPQRSEWFCCGLGPNGNRNDDRLPLGRGSRSEDWPGMFAVY